MVAFKTIGYIGTMGQGCSPPEGNCAPVTCRPISDCVDFRACFNLVFGSTWTTDCAFEVGVPGVGAVSPPCDDEGSCAGFNGTWLFDPPDDNSECFIQGFLDVFDICRAPFCSATVALEFGFSGSGWVMVVQLGVDCGVAGGNVGTYQLAYGDDSLAAINALCRGETITIPRSAGTDDLCIFPDHVTVQALCP